MPTAVDIAGWLDEALEAARYRAEEPENGLVVDFGRAGNGRRLDREHHLSLDRAGIEALGRRTAEQFGLEHRYVEEPHIG